MRTRTLLLTAALGAATVSSAIAQVYSVNTVGYINLVMKPGFNLVANQLNTGGNTLAEVVPTVPDGTLIFLYEGGQYSIAEYDGGWGAAATKVVRPGVGFWFQNIGTADLTVTFVGEVPEGELKTSLNPGFNLVASQVPQAGKVTTDLSLLGPPSTGVGDGDQLYKFTPGQGGGYSINEYDAGWGANEPSLAVGEAIWLNKIVAGSWDRTFDVSP